MNITKMNDAELDVVVGGTVNEFDELLTSYANNSLLKGMAKLDAHTLGANNAAARIVKKEFRKIGLEADIDLGWFGTGIDSEPNKYWIHGQRVSHSEACDYVRKYAG